MDEKTYHENQALGSSCLKYAEKSMRHFQAYQNGEIKFSSTDAFDLGSSAHQCILEKDTSRFVHFNDASIISLILTQRPDLKNVRACKEYKEAKLAFEGRNIGKIILSKGQYDSVVNMFNSFQSSVRARQLVNNGDSELSFFATSDNGLDLKARADYYVQSDDGDYIVDLKTSSKEIDVNSFSSTVANLGYDLQASHYIDVVGKSTGRPVKDYFWVVLETKAPYGVRIYRASDEMLSQASFRREKILNDIKAAKETDIYQGYTDEIVSLDVPAWFDKQIGDNYE